MDLMPDLIHAQAWIIFNVNFYINNIISTIIVIVDRIKIGLLIRMKNGYKYNDNIWASSTPSVFETVDFVLLGILTKPTACIAHS